MVRASAALLVAVLASASPAHADTAAQHVARGEELARENRFTDAIAAFKRADAIEPRASHACLIALAYIRRELWPQAEVFLATCHARATPDDPLPDWITEAEQQLEQQLASAPVARVRIVVVPESLAAQTKLEVSQFLPDEQFGPSTIHLPLGRHLITARAPGHEKVERAIEITDKEPRSVVISFEQQAVTVVDEHRSVVPTVVMGVGAATLVAGVAYHLFAFRPVRDHLVDATDPQNPNPALYDQYSDSFDTRRTTTMVLYGVGAATLLTGIVLRYTLFEKRSEQSPAITSDLHDGRVLIGVQWAR